jgi:uncharacterized protein (TIGR00730 family)
MSEKESEEQNSNQRNFTPVGTEKETTFLDGAHARWKEFMFLVDVMREFIKGFRKLHFVGPCITVFGSARFEPGTVYYELARKVGGAMADMGFTIMTGGGPGIMEAANRGAKEAGGKSVGCNIVLPKEQHPNAYLDLWIDIDYFFVRKVLLSKYSYGFVVMPGGYGTLDEFFDAIELIQTGKALRFPVVMMGTEYHHHLYKHLQKLVEEKTIGANDINLFLFTDSLDEAVEHIRKHAIGDFGLNLGKQMKPMKLLGEGAKSLLTNKQME